jgi:hypothetical protein
MTGMEGARGGSAEGDILGELLVSAEVWGCEKNKWGQPRQQNPKWAYMHLMT